MGHIRFSKQSQQEQISLGQIQERLAEYGWIASRPDIDLGEDRIIHIYIGGRATGVTFHAQAKSITNLAKRKKGNYLTYRLELKDLKHWSEFSTPVVIIIWDIKLREGRWAIVSDIVVQLDKDRPNWRTNKAKVNVRIPWENTLDDIGLTKLKQMIGQRLYPLIAGGKPLEVNARFVFPDTPEGQEHLRALERHMREGEPITLKGQTIQELRFSEWWDQWFGGYNLELAELYLGPVISQSLVPITIDVLSNKGDTVTIPNLQFRKVQAGTEYVKLTNDQQATPLQFTLEIRKLETTTQVMSISWTVRRLGQTLNEICTILSFLQAMADGGRMRLTFVDLDNQSLTGKAEPMPEVAPHADLVALVEELNLIQKKTGQFIRIPERGIHDEDTQAIKELHQIITRGSTTQSDIIATVDAKGEGLQVLLDAHRKGEPMYLQQFSDSSYVELFATKIETGPMSRDFLGFIEMPITELEAVIREIDSDQFVPIRLRGTVTESFTDWNTEQTHAPESSETT